MYRTSRAGGLVWQTAERGTGKRGPGWGGGGGSGGGIDEGQAAAA